MSPAICQPQGLDAQGRRIVAQLIDQYRDIRLSDRRVDNREDFVAAVDILNLSDRCKLTSALSIDMSPAGIRLVHQGNFLEPGEYVLRIRVEGASAPTVLRAAMHSCRELPGDWFSSGWQFLSVARTLS